MRIRVARVCHANDGEVCQGRLDANTLGVRILGVTSAAVPRVGLYLLTEIAQRKRLQSWQRVDDVDEGIGTYTWVSLKPRDERSFQ